MSHEKFNPLVLLDQLQATKAKTKVKKIVKEQWDSSNDDFLVGLQLALDNTIEAYTGVPLWDGQDDTLGNLTMESFYDQLIELKLNKNKNSKNIIKELAEQSGTDEWNRWYRRILTKEILKDLPMEQIVEAIKVLTTPKKRRKVTKK